MTSHFLTAIFGQVASKPIVPKAAAWKAAALATELAIAMLRRSFDITTMARLSVGSSWATLSEAQRHQVVESFGRYTRQSMPIVLTATPARNCRSPENSRLLVVSW